MEGVNLWANILSVKERNLYGILGLKETDWLSLLSGVGEFRSAMCNGNKLRCRNSYEITEAMNGYPDAKGAVNAVEKYLMRSGKIPPSSTNSIDGIVVPSLSDKQRAHNLALKAIARRYGLEGLFANP